MHGSMHGAAIASHAELIAILFKVNFLLEYINCVGCSITTYILMLIESESNAPSENTPIHMCMHAYILYPSAWEDQRV